MVNLALFKLQLCHALGDPSIGKFEVFIVFCLKANGRGFDARSKIFGDENDPFALLKEKVGGHNDLVVVDLERKTLVIVRLHLHYNSNGSSIVEPDACVE